MVRKKSSKNDLKRQERKGFIYKFIYIIIVGKQSRDRSAEWFLRWIQNVNILLARDSNPNIYLKFLNFIYSFLFSFHYFYIRFRPY